MVRCEDNDVKSKSSCSDPAEEESVLVSAGVPDSRLRVWEEIFISERSDESHYGGSKNAGRKIKTILQPRQIYNGEAEPLISRRRLRL